MNILEMTENKAILFVSHLIPMENYGEVLKNSKNNMQDAANALQWHLVEGFNHNLNGNYDIINFMPIGSFPQYYKKSFVKSELFDAQTINQAKNIGFCNVKYLRRKSIGNSLRRNIDNWCKDHKTDSKVIIVYTLNSLVLGALAEIKNKYADIEICAIVADLPDMMNLSSKRTVIDKAAQRMISGASYSLIGLVDKFVFLTKQMSDYIGNTKPFCVMEGIATIGSAVENKKNEAIGDGVKTVLYTGTLHRKFGILQLLEAFSMIDDADYRLIICGVGDSKEEILKAAETDKRIDFRGQCGRDEVLKLQQAATVLVNPRMNNEEFTKYSFPSKNMEYLSSGIPLIAYKLDGIPEEYSDYINYVDGEEPEKLAEKIKEICELDFSLRNEMGKKAQRFVFEEKNAVVQTKKMLCLICK